MQRRTDDNDQWRLKKELSIGDLIAIVVALVSVLSAYHLHDVRISVLEKEVSTGHESDADIKKRLETLDAKIDRVLERIALKGTK